MDILWLGQSWEPIWFPIAAIPSVINYLERMLEDFILCFDFTIYI